MLRLGRAHSQEEGNDEEEEEEDDEEYEEVSDAQEFTLTHRTTTMTMKNMTREKTTSKLYPIENIYRRLLMKSCSIKLRDNGFKCIINMLYDCNCFTHPIRLHPVDVPIIHNPSNEKPPNCQR